MKDDQKEHTDYEKKRLKAIRELETRHREQWKKTETRHFQKIEKRHSELVASYKLNETQNKIYELTVKLETPGLLPPFARKFLGIDRRFEEKIENLKTEQADVEKCISEDLEPLEQDYYMDMQVHDHCQVNEVKELAKRLEKWRASNRSENRSHDTHERDHKGPEISKPGLRR